MRTVHPYRLERPGLNRSCQLMFFEPNRRNASNASFHLRQLERSSLWRGLYRHFRQLPDNVRALLRVLISPDWYLAVYLVRYASAIGSWLDRSRE
jgi:hypothetical protein